MLSLSSSVIFLGTLPAMSRAILVLLVSSPPYLLRMPTYASTQVQCRIHSFSPTSCAELTVVGLYGSLVSSVEENDLGSNRVEIKVQFHVVSYNAWSFLHLLATLQAP